MRSDTPILPIYLLNSIQYGRTVSIYRSEPVGGMLPRIPT